MSGRVMGLAKAFGMKGLVYSTLAALIGALVGLGLFTFGYAEGFSYFKDDPTACVNCHAMNEEYEGWLKSSHNSVATCNDCHAPHDNIVKKYINKADNGFWHGLKFTTGDYPENIKIREVNRRVTEDACLYCHGDLVSEVNITRPAGEQISCIRCHSEVGHRK